MNVRCSTPETTCLQCGDEGFTNAFVYCIKCLKFAVHRYCLDVMPKSLDEFVRWVCDDCEAEVLNQPAVRKNDVIRCKTRDCTPLKHILGNSGVGTMKNDMVECEQSSLQQLEEGKVKDNLICNDRLSADSPLKESTEIKASAITVSTMRKDEHRLGTNFSKRPHEKYANIGIPECAKLASDSTRSMEVKENKASEKRDGQLFSQQLCELEFEPGTVSHRILSCNSSLESSKKKKSNMSSEANLEEQSHRTLPAQHLEEDKRPDLKTWCSEDGGINVSNDYEKNKESEAREDRTFPSHHKNNFRKGFSNDSKISSMVDCNVRAEPLTNPIWRGSFNIWNKNDDFLDGLMAHMSSQACQKVYDEACLFQPVLHLEMLRKNDVWPKSYERSKPSSKDIALYFFPSDIRSEHVFDYLVDEMVHKELALRAKVQNAELLVFTSTELPLPCWRFQDKYYLWGVFRKKQHL